MTSYSSVNCSTKGRLKKEDAAKTIAEGRNTKCLRDNRLHIIQPTHYSCPSKRIPHKTKKRELVTLTLPYLAALVPAEFRIRLTDEQTQNLDLDAPCDCVFLSITTLNSFRAYDIAENYRKKEIPVVMGGPHCFFHHDEAAKHADAVAIGEGETLIPRILEDLRSGKLQSIYRAESLHDLRGLPLPRHDLLDPRTFARFRSVAVQTSRGCPYRCAFCSERYYLGEKYRTRPVDDVIEEIRHTKSRRIHFSDSTFVGKRGHTLQLMEKLVPLSIQWSTLWNANMVLDRELMTLAKRSGVIHLNIGVDSINHDTLRSMNKKSTPHGRLKEMIKILRKAEISFSLNFILGWDTDKLEDFRATLEFVQHNKVPVAFFNAFSPHRGTPVFEDYLEQGKIRDVDNIDRWPGIGLRAEIYPTNFTAEQLEENIVYMYRQFYSWRSILHRLRMPTSTSSLVSWHLNVSQRKMFSGNGDCTNFDSM